MELADAQSAGEVVRPHRGAEDAGELAGQQAVTGEHREEEGEHAYEVGRGAAQDLPLREGFVDEPDFLLLQVPDAAVHELRRLG